MENKGPLVTEKTHSGRRGEEGSALILAALVTVILSLLGLSYLMMAKTENTIAENERNAAAALYVAEAGVRLVIAWFNDPTSTGYLLPASTDVDRTKRVFDHDNNTGTARVLGVSGTSSKPYYKDAAFTASPIFDRPYRNALADTFLGVETGTDPDPNFADKGPDLIVSSAFLTTINDTIFPNFPTPTLRARVTRIEIYAPPLVTISGVVTRMGVATVKVTAGVFMYPGTADERQVATRVVKAVENELPVLGPVGPLQSGFTVGFNGEFEANWGMATAIGDADLPGNLNGKVDSGLPYALNDPFTYINGANTLASWATAHNGESIEDPWFRFVSSGAIDEATNSNVQPWTFTFPGSMTDDHSNLFQHTTVNCPTFDYNLWKTVAQSGVKNAYYYAPVGAGATFRLDGNASATPVSFETATDGKSGIFFFDSKDGLPPNGLPTTNPGSNLTDGFSISGGGWGTQGFLYLNGKGFGTTGGVGVTRTVTPPGEPGDGSGFVNLHYPGTLTGGFTIRQGTVDFQTFQDPVTGDWFCTDAATCTSASRTPAGAPVRDNYGLPFQASIAIDGVIYVAGILTAQGNANYYGAVVADQGVVYGGETPGFFFDESLIKGNWPRKGMNLPRVVISSWQTDL